jgi:hypothetical protein
MVTLLSLGTVHTDCKGICPAVPCTVSSCVRYSLINPEGQVVLRPKYLAISRTPLHWGAVVPSGPSCLSWERDSRKALSQKGPQSSSWCALAASCTVFTLPQLCGIAGEVTVLTVSRERKRAAPPTGGGTKRKPVAENKPPS